MKFWDGQLAVVLCRFLVAKAKGKYLNAGYVLGPLGVFVGSGL
jgi:hypothetical protein